MVLKPKCVVRPVDDDADAFEAAADERGVLGGESCPTWPLEEPVCRYRTDRAAVAFLDAMEASRAIKRFIVVSTGERLLF